VNREEAGNFSDFAPPSRQFEQNPCIIAITWRQIPVASPNGNFRYQAGNLFHRTANLLGIERTNATPLDRLPVT
jgi:hypothetical protein